MNTEKDLKSHFIASLKKKETENFKNIIKVPCVLLQVREHTEIPEVQLILGYPASREICFTFLHNFPIAIFKQ